MHVLMAAVGSAGDVRPLLAIGQSLRMRGHEVEVMTATHFEPAVADAGLGFVAAGDADTYERVVAQPDLWHPTRGFALIVQALQGGLAAACATARAHVRPDSVLVGGTLAWNLRVLQEELRLPAATVHLSPSCIWSAQAPPRLPGLGLLSHLPAPLVRAAYALIESALLDPALAPELDRLRLPLGLPPVRRVMSRWLHAPDLVAAAWPAWFAPAQTDWPAHTVLAGFPFLKQPTSGPVDKELLRFLATGPAPVGITPGSAMAHGGRFIAKAVAACRSLGHRALVITPWQSQWPTPMPAGCHAVEAVPFDVVVPQLAALVHHGGIGTCAEALRAGVPQLVSPFAHDQFDNVQRLERLSVGAETSLKRSVAQWARVLDRLLGSEETRHFCATLALRMQSDPNAADAIADRIESLRPRPARAT